jgi:outer membrane protein
MKKFKTASIAVVLFCSFTTLNAQTEKGTFLLGGETKLNFSSVSSKFESDDVNEDLGKITTLEFSPQIGFFVIDGLALGMELPIMYSLEKSENEDKYTSTSLAFTPFIRYYFGKGKIKPYLHGDVGFGNLKMKYEDNLSGTTSENAASLFLYEMGGGLAIFLNDKVSLDIGIAYASQSLTPKDDNVNNSKIITSGFEAGIGIVFML